MRVIQGMNHVHTMMLMYAAVMKGQEVEQRGSKTRNVHNMAVIFEGSKPPLTAFHDRNLNLTYCKKEWLWYLGADAADDSIEQYAKMWQKLKQPDGTFYSNYGQYMFAEDANGMSQFRYILQTLTNDVHSRRASMMLLKREHLYLENTDTVCTYAINFTIEGGALNMSVMMRSNDVVYGFTNDAFCFWNLMEFVYQILSTKIPGLVRGRYTHFTNSMHVYERHYGMLSKILSQPDGGSYVINVPKPTPDEVRQLVKSKGKEGEGAYTSWLKAE